MTIARVVLLLACLSIQLFADGGTIILQKQAGDFEITVFSKSEVIRGGSNDLSVLVQRPDRSTVMDATVLLHLERTQNTGEIMRLTGFATHGKATDKMLYATAINIPATGQWHLNVDVSSGGKHANASGVINVLAPAPPLQNYWPIVAMVPLLMIAFVINRRLRAKFRARMNS